MEAIERSEFAQRKFEASLLLMCLFFRAQLVYPNHLYTVCMHWVTLYALGRTGRRSAQRRSEGAKTKTRGGDANSGQGPGVFLPKAALDARRVGA